MILNITSEKGKITRFNELEIKRIEINLRSLLYDN